MFMPILKSEGDVIYYLKKVIRNLNGPYITDGNFARKFFST